MVVVAVVVDDVVVVVVVVDDYVVKTLSPLFKKCRGLLDDVRCVAGSGYKLALNIIPITIHFVGCVCVYKWG